VRKQPQQVPTIKITIERMMATEAFRRGVADVRAGRGPNYDGEFGLMPVRRPKPGIDSPTNQQWLYERGRMFGIPAPRYMPVILPRAKRLNPKAIWFYRWNCWDGIL
jgi:hypothetical protein